MIESTRNKIVNIFNEIEGSQKNENIDDIKNKSIDEVIEIMLESKNDSRSSIDRSYQNNNHHDTYYFDMDELVKWKNNNNNIYEITPYWVLRSSRKVIGKFITFGKKVVRKLLKWYIEPIVEQQNRFNGSVTASINALYNNEIVTSKFISDSETDNKIIKTELNDIHNKLDRLEKSYTQKISDLENKNIEIYSIDLHKYEDILDKLNDLETLYKKDALELELRINNFEILHEEKILELEKKINDEKDLLLDKLFEIKNEEVNLKKIITDEVSNSLKIEERINTIKNAVETNIDYISFKLSQLKNEKFSQDIIHDSSQDKAEYLEIEKTNSGYEQFDYFKFENEFRGSRNIIKANQENYIEYFKGKNIVVDVGCGRGEFLELLKENDIPAVGVDLFEEFVKYCKYKNLNAVHGDGIEYIRNLQNESIEGIFASQIAEHLKTEQLYALCKESYKKLKPGCYFILETPNPTSLSIYTNAFYMDPSHIKPVHPKTLEFFLKESGFKEIRVVYTEQSKVNYRLPLLEGENINNLSEFNDGINLLSDVIFGSQDYAVIAKK